MPAKAKGTAALRQRNGRRGQPVMAEQGIPAGLDTDFADFRDGTWEDDSAHDGAKEPATSG